VTDLPKLQSKAITYEIDDLIALSRLVPRSAIQNLRIAAGALIILLAFTMVAEAWSLTGLIDWTAIVTSVLVAALLLLFSNRQVRSRLWLRFARKSPLYSPHSYEITPGALRISSPKGASDVRWTVFPDVRRVGDRLFVFMTKRQAFIIPLRAFDSTGDFDAFAAAAHDCWEQRHRL